MVTLLSVRGMNVSLSQEKGYFTAAISRVEIRTVQSIASDSKPTLAGSLVI